MKTKNFLLTLFLASAAYTAQAQEIKRETRGEQEYIVYKVQKGETVFSISKKYGIKTDDLITHNPAIAQVIKADDTIYVPVKIKNPKAEVENIMRGGNEDAPDENQVQISYTKHKVAKGQGLMAIARMYNITLDELKKWNDMEEVESPTIVPDQELIVGISTTRSSKKNNESKNTTASNDAKNMERTKDKTPIKKTENNEPKKMRGDDDIIFHEVSAGETLFKISQMYGLSEVDIMNENDMNSNVVKIKQRLKIVNPTKKPTKEEPAKAEEPAKTEDVAFVIYTVQQGDNLSKIQDKFNVSREEIRYWNGMLYESGTESHKNLIDLGEQFKIYLPKKLEHTVQKGETIESIKKKYNLNESDRPLEKWNNIPRKKLAENFVVGKTLTIYQPTGPQMTEAYKNGQEAPLKGIGKHNKANPTPKKEDNIDISLLEKKQHTVKDDQTLYEIAGIYKVQVADIKKWNNLTADALKPSQVLDIYVPKNTMPTPNNNPENNNVKKNEPITPTNNDNGQPVIKENKFDKSKGNNQDFNDFFNQPIPPKEEPKKAEPKKEEPKKEEPKVNPETAEAMKGITETPKKVEEFIDPYKDPQASANLTSPSEIKTETPKIQTPQQDILEKGLAEVLTTVVSSNTYAATHNTLPTGTMVLLKNPLNGKTIPAQIVAPMNEPSSPQVIIQVTRAIMDKLGATDAKSVEVEMFYKPR